MRYDFNCTDHGIFEVEQPILSNHQADCPSCSEEAQRIYSVLGVIWGGSLYRPDGSRREHDDYAPVMRG
ncbi:hypothetical protein LCGC14_2389540 [marine sediment metagenome]|uniref:Putative regulatory protein FmdB zinc ribbon domain-containing protein n=1 Tax=marine sediment metagenome TaxID=412755 RepID=A0A0F9BYP4_9ZZZZ